MHVQDQASSNTVRCNTDKQLLELPQTHCICVELNFGHGRVMTMKIHGLESYGWGQ